jgi:hypothetical protein
MTILKSAAVGAALLSSVFMVRGASAAVLDVTNVDVNSWNALVIDGRTVTGTAIKLTTTELPKPLWVFCVDLAHDITAGGHVPPVQYRTGLVTTDSNGAESGTGGALSLSQSGEIQTLANIGSGIANSASPNAEKLTAIAGAIWEVEYGYSPSQVVGTPTENALIAGYVSYAQAYPAAGYANGLYSVGGGAQGFGYSQGFATSAPEPATWSMMIVGAGLLGVALRRRRARDRAAILAYREV